MPKLSKPCCAWCVQAAPLDEDEWVKGTNYEVSKRKKATQRNKGAGDAE